MKTAEQTKVNLTTGLNYTTIQPNFISEWKNYDQQSRAVKMAFKYFAEQNEFKYIKSHGDAPQPYRSSSFMFLFDFLGDAYTSSGSYAGLWFCNGGYMFADLDNKYHFIGIAIDTTGQAWAIAEDEQESAIYIELVYLKPDAVTLKVDLLNELNKLAAQEIEKFIKALQPFKDKKILNVTGLNDKFNSVIDVQGIKYPYKDGFFSFSGYFKGTFNKNLTIELKACYNGGKYQEKNNGLSSNFTLYESFSFSMGEINEKGILTSITKDAPEIRIYNSEEIKQDLKDLEYYQEEIKKQVQKLENKIPYIFRNL